MKGDWTWGDFLQALLGVLQWTIAIVSVAGTLALFGWILTMVMKKDKAK
jgi:hypothetical protein